MFGIPQMKCQECDVPMECQGGPSDTNIFIMVCSNPACRRQKKCYAEPEKTENK